MNRRCVVFLMTGTPHLPYLSVALNTLRKCWSGHIRVFAWQESFEVAKKLCRDHRVSAECVLVEPEYRGKNAQEFHKIGLISNITDFDSIVYLDADLIIRGKIDPLFRSVERSEGHFAAVQFCDWTMHVGTARKRVGRLLDIPAIDQDCVRKALELDQPSFNSGIFATSPKSPLLKTWQEWTYASKRIFISGETSLHAVVHKYPHDVLPGVLFNCSPKYQPINTRDDEVVIWHGHGDCFTRPEKSEKGWLLWKPEFEECLRLNLGGIDAWWPFTENRFLNALMGPLPYDRV